MLFHPQYGATKKNTLPVTVRLMQIKQTNGVRE